MRCRYRPRDLQHFHSRQIRESSFQGRSHFPAPSGGDGPASRSASSSDDGACPPPRRQPWQPGSGSGWRRGSTVTWRGSPFHGWRGAPLAPARAACAPRLPSVRRTASSCNSGRSSAATTHAASCARGRRVSARAVARGRRRAWSLAQRAVAPAFCCAASASGMTRRAAPRGPEACWRHRPAQPATPGGAAGPTQALTAAAPVMGW